MSAPATITVVKKKWRVPLLFQLLIVIGVSLLIWLSFGKNVLAPQNRNEVPENLGRLELVNRVEGEEALSQVSQLHGTNISLLSAYIATYAHEGEKATVWAGKAENPQDANALLTKMVEGINKGNSPFTNLKSVEIAGQEVYQVNGPGGQHFFYVPKQANRVVWLTIVSNNPMPIMNLAVKIF